MSDLVEVKGLRELDRQLSELGPKLGLKALRSAMMAASKPMFLAARSNAESTGVKNRDAGATAAAMGRWVRKITPTTTVLYIGPKSKNKKALAIYNEFHNREKPVKRLSYAHLLEFGSVHGGAQPFLRPAFEATKMVVVNEFGRQLKLKIDNIVRKQRAG